MMQIVFFLIFLQMGLSWGDRTSHLQDPRQQPQLEQHGSGPVDLQTFMSDIQNNKITLPDILSGKVKLPAEIQDVGKEIAIHVISILLANVAVSMVGPPQPEPLFG